MAILEGFVLNGLNLNNEAPWVTEEVDLTPPKKKLEMAQGADSDGSDLIRTPLYENRTITASVRVKEATKDAALEKAGEFVDMLQEAEKNPGGIPLVWTPANSTKTITFYVLTGEVTGIPIVMEGPDAGYFAAAIKVNIALTCKPFGYGAEVEVAAAKSIEPNISVVELTIPTVAGDVPAEGRLVITDTAAVGRRFVEWGLENRYYNAATKLILDNEAMTPVGGTQSTTIAIPPAYKQTGATKGTLATSLVSEPTICASTGNLGHVGTFRVKARVWPSLASGGQVENMHLRLSWQDGEGPFRANTWQTPVTGNTFAEVDLGIITIAPAQSGTQKWSGRIEAYTTNAGSPDILYLDYLLFIPAGEGYGKARGANSSAPGTIAAFDNYTTGTLSGTLNGRTPPIGAAWATSGATTDFAVEASAAKRVTTSDAGPRYAVIGSALANSKVDMQGEWSSTSEHPKATIAFLLRWVSSESYAFLLTRREQNAIILTLGVKVAGTTTVLQSGSLFTGPGLGPVLPAVVVGGELIATLDGGLTAVGGVAGIFGRLPFSLSGSHSALATGGALASGKGGVYDENPLSTPAARKIQLLSVSALPGIPYCIAPSQSMEVRSDSTITEDSTGIYAGPVPEYRGSRFLLPQDGSANRTSRLFVKADRNDLEAADQFTIADPFTAAAWATPRYSVIPR